MRRKRGIEIRQ